MLYSMTGYGQSIFQNEKYSCKIDIRALNNKNNELNLRLPFYIRDKESDIRNLISEAIGRGKTDVNIFIETFDIIQTQTYNSTLVKSVFHEIQKISESLETKIENPLSLILQLPETKNIQSPQTNEELFLIVKNTIFESIKEFMEFRKKEGEKMENDIFLCMKNLSLHKDQIKILEPARAENQKLKLASKLEGIKNEHSIDNDRFEQEIIFYLEKLDINEELIRLQSHLDYFHEICLDKKNIQKGKKLSFIAQEIGREINTIGSKANDAQIQHLVVNMKDELEKIKEMLNNVL